MILVVEDDDDIRRTLVEALCAARREAEGVANGVEALARLEHDPRPQLVLLDLRMPEMTGWELIERMQTEPELAAIPIVVTTVNGSEAAKLVGIAGFLTKPFNLAELYAVLDVTLPARRT